MSLLTLADDAKTYAGIVDGENERTDVQLIATKDGKTVYALTLKGVNQPTFSFYHTTQLTGGFVCEYSVADAKWIGKHVVPVLDADENREDAVFMLGNTMHMLVYSMYTKFEYRALYKWTQNKWTPVKFDVDSSALYPENYRSHLTIVNDSSEDSIYVCVDNESGGTMIDCVKIGAADASVARVGTAEGLLGQGMHGWRTVVAGKKDDKVYIMGGASGCGFRWIPDRLEVVDVKTKAMTEMDIGGTAPPWGFSGVSMTSYVNGEWMFIGGSIQQGMTNTVPDGTVYSIVLTSDGATWKQHSAKVPFETYYAACDGQGVVYGEKDGKLVSFKI